MKIKSPFIILLAGLTILFPFSDCRKKCLEEQVVTEDSFRSGQYDAIMPFTERDTLRFLLNKTDTVLFLEGPKQIFYNVVERGGGDCLVKYRLLNHKITFSNSKVQSEIVFWYYRYSETTAFQDYFEINYNDLHIGPQLSFDIGLNPNKLNVLGKEYPYAKGFTNNQTDSLYLNFNSGDKAIYKILRMKYLNNIYEVIP